VALGCGCFGDAGPKQIAVIVGDVAAASGTGDPKSTVVHRTSEDDDHGRRGAHDYAVSFMALVSGSINIRQAKL
jgi:hypothetical protein